MYEISTYMREGGKCRLYVLLSPKQAHLATSQDKTLSVFNFHTM
jgi:hypothetical protein